MFVIGGTARATPVSPTPGAIGVAALQGFDFALPANNLPGKCFAPMVFGAGGMRLAPFSSSGDALAWTARTTATTFGFRSGPLPAMPAGGSVSTYAVVSSVATNLTSAKRAFGHILASVHAADTAFEAPVTRWKGYLATVLMGRAGAAHPAPVLDAKMQWIAVKAAETLINNWRVVPGVGQGVLPSYNGYDSGMWSWDTYKQAVGMASWAPTLAKDQLRVLVAGRDPKTDHIPDKVDRCGVGGGCAGKPPLLSWSVWEVHLQTGDDAFLAEMYPVIDGFHRFWYAERDTEGVGLCSWTGGMESGMDDGVRFDHAQSVSNKTTGVRSFNFHSIDLNAYLYREKRTLAKMATVLGNTSGAAHWTAQADELLPRLQERFYKPDPSGKGGFFQDRYFNGTFLDEQGCEGYAALFCEVATPEQAANVAVTLSDPTRFLLNFSLPTVSAKNSEFNPNGYWKGSTWLDQVWFAYAGLKLYSDKVAALPGSPSRGVNLGQLADEIKHRTLAGGKGFAAGDTTPFNEHYNPNTGQPIGAQQFSWTAAHSLMWAFEGRDIVCT